MKLLIMQVSPHPPIALSLFGPNFLLGTFSQSMLFS